MTVACHTRLPRRMLRTDNTPFPFPSIRQPASLRSYP